MPPAYVKPYVKRQKNDMADAEAICEVVTRANMRFVPAKTPEQQSCLMLRRGRHLQARRRAADGLLFSAIGFGQWSRYPLGASAGRFRVQRGRRYCGGFPDRSG